MRAAVLSVALIACAYRPGSFSHYRQDFPGRRTTVGCIDIAVDRRPDLSTGGTVLAYEFANRCDRAAPRARGDQGSRRAGRGGRCHAIKAKRMPVTAEWTCRCLPHGM